MTTTQTPKTPTLNFMSYQEKNFASELALRLMREIDGFVQVEINQSDVNQTLKIYISRKTGKTSFKNREIEMSFIDYQNMEDSLEYYLGKIREDYPQYYV